MRVHVLQHVPFEGLGSIADWLEARGAQVSWTRFYKWDQLPALEGIDLVIAMGGPMSVNDEAEYPWLVDEKAFIAAAAQRGSAVLGICLGAQLIASALKARVCPNPEREIGWFEIAASAHEADDVFRFPDEVRVFHWHGETFDLPVGATRLAQSVACQNQAFQYGDRVLGLQFHLEVTPQSMEAMIEGCGDELVPATWVQIEQVLRQEPEETYVQINRLVSDILNYLTR